MKTSYTLVSYLETKNTVTMKNKLHLTSSLAMAVLIIFMLVPGFGWGQAPLVSFPTAANITNTSADLGGTITDNGGDPITERGTVWSTLFPVTIADNKEALVVPAPAPGVFTQSRSGLPAKTYIHYAAYATNVIATVSTTTLSPAGNFWTLADEPTTHASGFTATPVSTTSIDLSWTTASAGADGYLILQRTGATAPTGIPSDATGYSVGTIIGDAIVAANIFSGVAATQTITGLLNGTQYSFTIIPYSFGVNPLLYMIPNTYNYLTTAVIPSASATTNSAPVITSAPATLAGFTYIQGSGPSAEQTFTVSGANLTNNISIAGSANYEISTISGGESAAPVILIPSLGTVSNTTIYVRLKSGLTAAAYNGEVINITSAGATPNTVTCSGTVINPVLSVGALSSFGNVCINSTTLPFSFTITGTDLSIGNVVVGALPGYAYSTTSGGTYSSTLTLPQAGGAFSATVYVQFSPAIVQSYNGNIIISGGGATSVNRAATGSGVNTSPSVTTINPATLVTGTTATCDGNVTVEGCGAITARGICYGTSVNPDITGTLTTEPVTTGLFSSLLTGLTPVTTYHYRAYVTSSVATTYGSDFTFTTHAVAPTTQASYITFSAVTATGMTASWTNGNGTKRIVLINSVNSFTNPTDGTDPLANTTYDGSGEQVVYNGNGNSVIVALTNPIPNNYVFKVIEYNGTGSEIRYCTATGAVNPENQSPGTLSGTKTVGVGGDYATLTAAISDLNSHSLSGALNLILTDNTYTDLTETFPLVINHNLGSSATSTITIKPAPGVSPVIISNNATSVFLFQGSDYVIIDGSNQVSGTSKDLTIINTNAGGAYNCVIDLLNAPTKITTNSTIKNCIIKATPLSVNSWGIALSNGGYYPNTSIINNTIKNANIGIQFVGAAGKITNNGIISNNIIGDATEPLTQGGITMSYCDNTLITGNEIFGMAEGNTEYQFGISIGTGNTNTKIRKNKIHDYYYNGTNGGACWGIYYNAEATSPTEISNNLIYNIKGDGDVVAGGSANAKWIPSGISIMSGGNLQIYHNTINMTGNVLGSPALSHVSGNSSCLMINASVTNLDVRNNIFKNSMNRISGNGDNKTYGIVSHAAAVNLGIIDFNDYFIDGVNPQIGFLSADLHTLSDWQAATAKDNHSISDNPGFVLPTDIYPQNAGLNNKGTFIPAITTDYAGTSRFAIPDIGAYEFSLRATVTTAAATGITASGAALNGLVNANNESAAVTIQYGLSVSYDNTITLPGTITGSVNTAVSSSVAGLLPNTAYHFRVNATTIAGSANGNDLTFTTNAIPPAVVTNAATNVNSSSARLIGTVNANYASTTVTFQYGLTTSYGSLATSPAVSGGTATTVMANISGLTPNTTYHYRCVGANVAGATNGNDQIFSTPCLLPVPALTGPISVCANSSGIVYSTETGMHNYSWIVSAGGTISAGGTATDNSITITWNTAGAQSVSVNYTNVYNCTATAATVYFVTVNPLPVPVITGPASACSGSTGNTYSTAPGMSGYTWTISSGGTITSGAGTNIIIVNWNTAGTQTLNVNYTNANNCSAVVATVYNVNINPHPLPTISGPATVCAGSAGNSYTTTAGMTGYTWTVSAGGTITAGAGTNAIAVTWNTAGAQTVNVNYINASSCTAAEATIYAVTVHPLPAAIAGTDRAICMNTSTILGAASVTGSTYSWTTVPAGFTSTDANPSVTPLVNTTYTVVETVAATGCTSIHSVVVTVNPLPVVTAGTYGPVCIDAADITLAGTPAGGVWTGTGVSGTGPYVFDPSVGTQLLTYTYTNDNSCVNSAATTVTVNPLPVVTTGTYGPVCIDAADITLAGTPAGGVWAGTGVSGVGPYVFDPSVGTQLLTYTYTNVNSCVNSAATTVTVNPLPVVTTGTYGPVCIDAADITLVGTPAGGVWTGTGVSGTGPYVFDPSVGTQLLTYTYTNGNSCVNAAATTVTVNPTPAAIAGADRAICLNSGTTLGAADVTGNTYSWTSSPVGYTSTIANPTVTPLVTTTYTVTETITATGCTNTHSVVITVNPLPVAAAGTNRAICLNSSTTLGAAAVAGNTYSWISLPAGFTSTAANPTVTPLVTATYLLTETIPASGCSITHSVVVTVNPLPVPAITGPASICAGSAGNTYATATGMTGYTWTVSAGGIITAGIGTNTITVTWNTAGSQNVSASYTNASSCSAAAPTVYNVTVNPIPAAPVITLAGYVLTSNAALGNQWYFGGVLIQGATGATYTAQHTGSYTCIVTLNGCASAVSNSIVVNFVGINTVEGGQFELYPVPSNGLFTATLAWPKDEVFTIRVYSSLGSLMYEKKDIQVSGSAKQLIDMSNAPSGMYTVTFTSGNNQVIRKMIINRQ